MEGQRQALTAGFNELVSEIRTLLRQAEDGRHQFQRGDAQAACDLVSLTGRHIASVQAAQRAVLQAFHDGGVEPGQR